MCICVKIDSRALNIIISGPDYAEVRNVFNVRDNVEDSPASYIVANIGLIAQTKVEVTTCQH